MKPQRKITIATRKSPLALWQAEYVKQCLLTRYANLTCDILTQLTEGDRSTDRSLLEIGGKDLFVKDLQKLVISEAADIAVHSLKDMSVHNHAHCQIIAFCKRDDPRDAFLSHRASTLMDLPAKAIRPGIFRRWLHIAGTGRALALRGFKPR